MAKDNYKTRTETRSTEEIGDMQDSEPVVVTKSVPKAAKVKSITTGTKPALRFPFDRYAVCKAIKPSHISGMKAFVSNPQVPRTMEEWDAIFATY